MFPTPTFAFPRKEAAKSQAPNPQAHEHCSPPSSFHLRYPKPLYQASAAAKRGGASTKRPARQNKNRKPIPFPSSQRRTHPRPHHLRRQPHHSAAVFHPLQKFSLSTSEPASTMQSQSLFKLHAPRQFGEIFPLERERERESMKPHHTTQQALPRTILSVFAEWFR